MNHSPSLSLFFPAYNESGSITRAVNQADRVLKQLTKTYEIIVVNDGSRDDTGAIADALATKNHRVRVVHHPQNQGYGAAVTSGLHAAKYDYVFFTDADMQFDLKELKKLLVHVPAYEAVLGYRAHRQDPFFRRVNAYGWNVLNRIAFGLKVRDIDCAFKLLKRDRVQNINLTSRGAMVSAELLIHLQRQCIPFKEVAVTHMPRTSGSPTGAKPSVILRALRELFQLYRGELGSVTHKQVVKFAFVGGINTVLDLIAYYVLTRYTNYFGDHIIITKITTFATASLFSFFANHKWTFRRTARPTWIEFFRFYLTIAIAIVINAGSLYIFAPIFGHDIPAALCATVTTFIWNFTISKFWVFSKEAKQVTDAKQERK